MSRKPHLIPINKELIFDRLRYENPWWITSEVDEEINEMKRRLYFDLFYPLIEDIKLKRAVVLMGPRRVGKTVMMQHAISELLKNKVDSQTICYIGIDNPIFLNLGLEELFKIARDTAGNKNPKGWYVFFDEIQYLKNWEVHLKVLVDSYPNTKFVVSGSAAAALKLKSNESGAGRFTEFLLPPLTFHEYIHLKGLEHLMRPDVTKWQGNITGFYNTINVKELNDHFLNYINFGGYPEVIFSEKIQSNPSRFIRNDIVDKVLLRDLPSLYGIQDVQELNSFFTTLAYYSGNEVSLDSLSKSSGADKNLLKKYLEYLEAAFLIRVVHRVDDNAKRFKRAYSFKVYLTNPSLRSAIFSPLEFTDELIGSMVETAIYAQWLHRDWFTPRYAKWSNGRQDGEVDMVGIDDRNFKAQWALEIKWSNRYFDKPVELKSLLDFCTKNALSNALVTTIDKQGVKEYGGVELHYYPSAVYAYVVGANTIDQKKKQIV